jgi:hypothetical protein
MKTTTERAREQAAKFVQKNINKFSEHPELWIESITLELLQFQFNEFKLEQISQKDINNELAKYL